MGSSYTCINVHIIFHVKSNNHCLMKENDLPRIFQYIGGIVKQLSGYPYAIGGCPDHLHILTTLPTTTNLSDFVRAIKAGSSKWIKNIDESYHYFGWQEGYGAFSVSGTRKNAVINYIKNQKKHHQEHTSAEEMRLFIKNSTVNSDEEPEQY